MWAVELKARRYYGSYLDYFLHSSGHSVSNSPAEGRYSFRYARHAGSKGHCLAKRTCHLCPVQGGRMCLGLAGILPWTEGFPPHLSLFLSLSQTSRVLRRKWNVCGGLRGWRFLIFLRNGTASCCSLPTLPLQLWWILWIQASQYPQGCHFFLFLELDSTIFGIRTVHSGQILQIQQIRLEFG